LPPTFAGFAGSIGINVLTAPNAPLRVGQNCFYSLDRNGRVKERWTQWDSLCKELDGPGFHRVRISPYDRERRIWIVNETSHEIYIFSNDGKSLLKTLGERNVPGKDGRHFAKPQDVAFLPDGRVLIADGLDNHRVMILDRNLNYLSEFGGFGTGPGAVQWHPRGRDRARRSHLRARPIERAHQRLPYYFRSRQSGISRGVEWWRVATGAGFAVGRTSRRRRIRRSAVSICRRSSGKCRSAGRCSPHCVRPHRLAATP
jgi:hypothetical protein